MVGEPQYTMNDDNLFSFNEDGFGNQETNNSNNNFTNNTRNNGEAYPYSSSFFNVEGSSPVRGSHSEIDPLFNDDNIEFSDYGDEYEEDNLQNTTSVTKEHNEDDETLLQTTSYSEDKVEQFIKGEDFAGLSKEIEKLLESDNATPRLGNQTTTSWDKIGAEYSSLSNSETQLDQNDNALESRHEQQSSSFITDEEAEERLRSLLLRLDKSKISETISNTLTQSPQLIRNTSTQMVPDIIELSQTNETDSTQTFGKTQKVTPGKKIGEIIEKYEYLENTSHSTEKQVHSSKEDHLFDDSSNYSSLTQSELASARADLGDPIKPVSENSIAPSTPSLSSLINENIKHNIINQENEVEISNISAIYEENITNLIEMKLEPISQLLRSSGYAGFLGETDIVQRIKETFKMMLEDMERKTKTIELQSKNQQEFTKTMLKLKQQVEKTNDMCNQYKVQMEKKDNELKAFKDNNHMSNSKSEKEITQLKKSVEGMGTKVSQYESTIIVKDEEINDLKKKMYQIVSKEETKRINAMNIFCQVNKRKPATKTDLKEVDIIAMYEEQRAQLKREIAFLKTEIQRLNESEVQNQNESEMVQKNEEQIKKLITQARMERERNSKLETEFNTAQQKLNSLVHQNQRVIANLEEENNRLLNELKGRPQAEDFENLRQKSEALRKELINKDKELTELKKSVDKSAVLTVPGGKWNSPDTKKKKQTIPEKEDQKDSQLTKEIVQEVCKILNVSDIGGLVASLQKMVSIVKAVPKMEKFICEICDICKKGTVDLGTEIDLKPKVVAPLLNYWIEKLKENQEMEKEITQLLNNRTGKSPIDYSDPDYKEVKRQILISIEEMVSREYQIQ